MKSKTLLGFVTGTIASAILTGSIAILWTLETSSKSLFWLWIISPMFVLPLIAFGVLTGFVLSKNRLSAKAFYILNAIALAVAFILFYFDPLEFY